MGQTSGKPISEDLHGFNRDEHDILEANLKPFVVREHSIVDIAKLQKLLESSHLSTIVSARLCKIFNNSCSAKYEKTGHKLKKSHHNSRWEDLLVFLSKIMLGNSEGLSEVIIRISNDSDINDSVSAKQLFLFLCEICKCYYMMIMATPPAVSWHLKQRSPQQLEGDANKLVHNQLQQLIYKGEDVKETSCHAVDPLPDGHYSKYDLETWLTKTPIILNILETVFSIAFRLKSIENINCEEAENYSELLPMCENVKWDRFQPILTPSDVLILNQSLPARLRSKWRLLFSSSQHGESFSQMLGRFVNQGPTLLVIRDRGGATFGGFASESWTLKPQFAGTSECFLFKLHTNVGVYNSTGFNDHYMYLNLNQQTMPNGLGMGGQLEYFGLFLDSEYSVGKCSKSCTTYHSPLLSSTEDFTFHDMEVWGLGQPTKAEDDENSGGKPKTKSILDKVDSGLKTVMEMAGRELKSEAVREEDRRAEKENLN